jgi:hypothetical protein
MQSEADAATTQVQLLDYVANAPADWMPRPPESTMRLAEFTLPASADGGQPVEAVVYFFGAGQGGSADANVERWRAQFFDESGGHPQPEIETLDGVEFPTTVVKLRGRYARAIGMGGTPDDAVPDQVLLAAVVETPSGNLFVQAHGPSDGVLAAEKGYYALVRSIRSAPPM